MRSYSWEGLEKALETEESHCKGPEVWSGLEYSRNRKEVCEAGAHFSDQGYLASDSSSGIASLMVTLTSLSSSGHTLGDSLHSVSLQGPSHISLPSLRPGDQRSHCKA